MCEYMLAIVGQTANSNWLTIFRRIHGYPEGDIGKTKFKFIFQKSLFFLFSKI